MQTNYLKCILFKGTMLFCLAIFIISCGNDKTLVDKIEILEKENILLKDSLREMQYKRIISSELILSPHKLAFDLNKKNRISGFFYQQEKFPKYEIFLADKDFKYTNKDKIDFEIQEDGKFEFDYIPKQINENTLSIVTVIDLDSVQIKLYGRTDLPVK